MSSSKYINLYGILLFLFAITIVILNTFQININLDFFTKNPEKNKKYSLPYYVINIESVQSKKEAKQKVDELSSKGYRSGFLWIPDYRSLSGRESYSIYIGPYLKKSECEIATEKYRKIYPDAYGVLVSNENKRVEIRGVGKINTIRDYKNIKK
jgi:hypothetical protein